MADGMMKAKVARNFSEDERTVIADIIKTYPAIEGKGYDSKSLEKKKSAWEKVFREFSANFPGRSPRTIQQLKGCWKRMKMEAKKETGAVRASVRLTERGLRPYSSDTSARIVQSVRESKIKPQELPDDQVSPVNYESNSELRISSYGSLVIPEVPQVDLCNSLLSSAVKEENRNQTTDHSFDKRHCSDETVEEMQLQLLKEAIKTEKSRQDLLRIQRWIVFQEAEKKGYGMPPKDF